MSPLSKRLGQTETAFILNLKPLDPNLSFREEKCQFIGEGERHVEYIFFKKEEERFELYMIFDC